MVIKSPFLVIWQDNFWPKPILPVKVCSIASQAKLVLLANLASGLMSGTTSKRGIGGAMEVFGRALGPAVNNYATLKLKENELENNFMQSALEIASDEMERKNQV